MKYEIIDNAIPNRDFLNIQNLTVWNSAFPWYLCKEITVGETKSAGFYSTHMFYNIREGQLLDPSISNYCEALQPIIEILEPKAIIRIKGNFYPQTTTLIEHEPHVDLDFLHKGAIFSLNSCDGFTRLDDGTKIDSVENRLLLLDPTKLHNSTTCTTQLGRFNINFNYL